MTSKTAKKPKLNSKTFGKLLRLFNQNQTDPNMWGHIKELPNPDPILRKAGKTAEVYEEISRDGHVIAELRTLRSGMFAFNAELVPGGDDAASMKSYEIAKAFMAKKPDTNTEWADLDWHNYSAILNGFSVLHLGAYEKKDGYWLPTKVQSWQGSRFAFDGEHNLLVKTKEAPRGEETDPTRWTCVRHMPTAKNPYGIALLSSCFWPWTFKHGGFKFFVQLTERFGIPFPIGKYPVGAQDKDIEALLEGLTNLVQDGVAAIPDDTRVEILESKLSGEPVPLQLINLCNSEISKILTSQTLATEQKNGGARAASETHAKRAGENQRADRALVASARNQILSAIHDVNFDSGVAPKYIYKDKKEINLETVNRVKETARIVPISVDWAYQELGVPAPKDGEEILEIKEEEKGIATPAKSDFSKYESNPNNQSNQSNQGSQAQFDEFDRATEVEIDKIWQYAKNADSLTDLKIKITEAFPEITQGALVDITKSAFELEFLQGMDDENKTVTIDDVEINND